MSSVLLGQSSIAQLEEALPIFTASPKVEFDDDDDIKCEDLLDV